jgi:hypothetical protein
MIGQFRGFIDIGYGGIRNVADDGCDRAGWWCCFDAGHAGFDATSGDNSGTRVRAICQ